MAMDLDGVGLSWRVRIRRQKGWGWHAVKLAPGLVGRKLVQEVRISLQNMNIGSCMKVYGQLTGSKQHEFVDLSDDRILWRSFCYAVSGASPFNI